MRTGRTRRRWIGTSSAACCARSRCKRQRATPETARGGWPPCRFWDERSGVRSELLDDLNESAKAKDNWRKAIELDPLVSEYYISLGKTLLEDDEEGAAEEGERLLRLALEIEPDNLYLEKNLERILRDAKRKTAKN